MMADEKVRPTAEESAEFQSLVLAEQVSLLVRRRDDLLVNLVMAAIVSAVLTPLLTPWLTVAWLGVFSLVIAVRYLGRRHFHRIAPPPARARAWGRMFALSAFATACLWGLTAFAILFTRDPIYQIFIIFLVGGMMAGGIVTNAAYLPAMTAFLLPTIAPLFFILISRPDVRQMTMGVIVALFTLVLVGTGRRINASIVQNLSLRFRKNALLDQLQASEAAMAEAQKIAHVGGLEFDVAQRRIMGSQEAWRIFGLDPATREATFDTLAERVHPDDRARIGEMFIQFVRTGAQSDLDCRIVMQDGAVRYLHWSGRATLDAEGRPLRFLSTVQDVTERVQGETIRARLAAVVHSSNDAICSATASGEIISWNRAAERLFGYGADEAVGKNLRMIIPPDRRAEFESKYRTLSEGQSVEAFDTERLRKDGALIPVSMAASPILDSGGDFIGTSFIARDISERKQAAAALAYREHLLHGVTVGTGFLMESGPLGQKVERALRIVGECLTVDRVVLMQENSAPATALPMMRYVWQADGVDTCLDQTAAELSAAVVEAIAQWHAPLAANQPVIADLASVAEQVRPLFERAHIKSSLLVPIFVAGKLWGSLGVDACRAPRCWKTSEIDTLKTFGDIAGSVIAQQEMQEALSFANLLLKTQSEASLEGIAIVDQGRSIVSFNQRFADLWGLEPGELAGGADDAVRAKVAASIKDSAAFAAHVQHLYDHPGEDSREELETKDGRFIDLYTATLYGPARAYLGRAWFFRDITERKRVEALALQMARYDLLTGLANRAVFVDALQHAVATAKRGERGFAVLYLDLDHFKDVNDTLGHPIGDELLKSVAERLRENTRETDTVARFGGDEFAIVVTDVRDPDDAAILADKLIRAFGLSFMVQGNEIHCGVSIGVAAYGPEAPDPETLLSQADVALYRAKAEGRGSYRFFTDAMDHEVKTRVALGAELRTALSEGQLFLMYQPQIAFGSGRITGMEALVRWRHPQRGVIGPEVFIPIAEQIGIIGKLGHWVLWEACTQGKAWLDAGLAPIRIAVNVSALQFRAPVALEADILAALEQTGLPPALLELELTETVLMNASLEHSDLLQRLQHTGVTVALDDFGTGYSSLHYLSRYPTDRIKIAQNFVANLERTPTDAAIIKATIGLARELGISVVVEGVETQKQYELLQDWGCDEAQGYYLARPLMADEAAGVLRSGRIVPGRAARRGGASVLRAVEQISAADVENTSA